MPDTKEGKKVTYGYRQSNARLALQKLDELEASILHLGDHPDIGMITR